MKYSDWIAAFEARWGGPEATIGRCKEAAHEMAEAFPELVVKPGHVECPSSPKGV